MIALSLLIICATPQRNDPAAAVRTITVVERLLNDVGVKGPFSARSVTTYSQGAQRTGWNVQVVAASGDVYEAYVGESSRAVQIARGHFGNENQDLVRNLPLPPDSPVIFEFADDILGSLRRRYELGQPRLTLNLDNSVELRAPIVKSGRRIAGPEDSEFMVRFRPDRKVVLDISKPPNTLPTNASSPSLSMEIARAKAEKLLREKVVQKNKNSDDATLTAKPELVYFHGFLAKTARLAFCFTYKVFSQDLSKRDDTSGEIFIDAMNGVLLGSVLSDARQDEWRSTRVGKYLFVDASAYRSHENS